ncbi:A24 family peptidase [Gordonia iterans]
MTWALLALLAAVAAYDRRTGRAPNALTLPLLLIAVLAAWEDPVAGLAAVTLTAPYLAGFAARGCGGGDVKLAPGCGVLLGSPSSALVALLLAAVLTVAGCALARRRAVPHGPALVAAALLVAAVDALAGL